MHFSLSTILTIVPLLASATPLTEQPHTAIPLSKRSNLYQPDGSVNIGKLNGHRASSVAKVMGDFDNYQKNTGKCHPMRPDVVNKRALSRVPLTNEKEDDHKEIWYGPISVGTPPKQFTVQYDTGSADLFLPDLSCGSTCANHTLYHHSASTTAQPLGKPFSMMFGRKYTLIGTQYNDTVNIAGLTATSQTLGSATKYSTGFQSANFPADGVMGMGFQSLSVYNAPPVFQTLVSQGQAVNGVFAFKLASSGSELTIGGLNSALYSGPPIYTPVTEKRYWQIEFTALTIGGTAIVDEPTPAIVNSGMNFILGSLSGVRAFYAKIPGSQDATSSVGAGFYSFPCLATIPHISFTIGGKALDMSASSLILGPVKPGSSKCVGSIVADGGIANYFWVLGESWMRNYYTIFDYDKSRVGFADLNS